MKELGWYNDLTIGIPLLLIFNDSNEEHVCLGRLVDNAPTSGHYLHRTKVTKVFYNSIKEPYNTYYETKVGDTVKASAGEVYILTENEYDKFFKVNGKKIKALIQSKKWHNTMKPKSLICSNCGKNMKECKCVPDWFKEKVKSEIDFYKKYKNGDSATKDTEGITKFIRDFPDVYSKADFRTNSWWNDWLFDYCFADVTDNFEKRTEEAYKRYEKGEFKRCSAKEFKKKLKEW